MSHVRINPWKDAPVEQRRPFGRKRRQWVAHVPDGCDLGDVNWERRLEATLDDGSTVVAGTDPRRRTSNPRGTNGRST